MCFNFHSGSTDYNFTDNAYYQLENYDAFMKGKLLNSSLYKRAKLIPPQSATASYSRI